MNLSEMQWLNEPDEWTVGDSLVARAKPETDFWRETNDSGIRHNGHFLFASVSGDFRARVKLTGQYNTQYDQAGIMVLASEYTWLKCGIELLDGRQRASSVVTRNCSDWSVTALENPTSVWIQCERSGATATIHYSLDGNHYELMRKTFLTNEAALEVGLMFAAPKGNGFDILFEDFLLTSL